MSLRDPSHKMSKSHKDTRSRVLVTDSKLDIQRKINGSLTDSIRGVTYDPINRPGVANLIRILSYLDGKGEEASVFADRLAGASLKDLKHSLAQHLDSALEPIRERFQDLTQSNDGIKKLELVAAEGKEAALRSTAHTLDKVYRAMGLR